MRGGHIHTHVSACVKVQLLIYFLLYNFIQYICYFTYFQTEFIFIFLGESRLCYHGVPRIIPTPWPKGDEYTQFLSKARINLNIRQVLNPDQNSL